MAWVTVSIDTGIFWPTAPTTVRYGGFELLLLPESDDTYASVSAAHDLNADTSGHVQAIRRFLSALAWVTGGHASEVAVTGCGLRPLPLGKGRGRAIDPEFRHDYLPEPADDDARFALAIYREALGADSVSYQFLGFAKVLNLRLASGRDQIAWIRTAVPRLTDHRARERAAEIAASDGDVAEYLYVSGRCAIAHTNQEPRVDPEDPADLRRLSNDLPLIRALAEHFIETELGVQTRAGYRNEHLYELAGFRAFLGTETVDALKRGQIVAGLEARGFPPLALSIRDDGQRPSLASLDVRVIEQDSGVVHLHLASPSGLLEARMSLDLPAERMRFDLTRDMATHDDGTPAAVEAAIDAWRFCRALMLNGQLELRLVETSELWCRCDPFIATNVDLRRTIETWDEEIARLEAHLARRRADLDPPSAASPAEPEG